MEFRQKITRTVDGTQYEIEYSLITVIASQREAARSAARCGNAPDNAFILRDLRKYVAGCLGIDQRTAYNILASIKYSQLFK